MWFAQTNSSSYCLNQTIVSLSVEYAELGDTKQHISWCIKPAGRDPRGTAFCAMPKKSRRHRPGSPCSPTTTPILSGLQLTVAVANMVRDATEPNISREYRGRAKRPQLSPQPLAESPRKDSTGPNHKINSEGSVPIIRQSLSQSLSERYCAICPTTCLT